jgi:hypothetical protein
MQTQIAQTIAQQMPRYNVSADLSLNNAVVDRLMMIKAQIDRLKREEDELKAGLCDTGLKVIEGLYGRAAISYDVTKVCVDWKAVAQHLKPSRQLVTAHTTKSEPYNTVRVSAKKTS